MISLDLNESGNFKLKIISNWDTEKPILDTLWNKRAIKKGGQFDYYLVPKDQLRDILTRWNRRSIEATPEVEEKIDDYFARTIPLRSLPKIRDPLELSQPAFDFQENYIRIHKSKKNLFCAFSQGLGKTWTSLERLKLFNPDRVMIICPKAAISNWKAEIRKVYGEEAIKFQGLARERKAQKKEILEKNPRFTITTYESISDFNIFQQLEKLGKFSHLIMDETHLVAKKSTQRFNHLKDFISYNNPDKQFLSGTPIQHKVRNLWPSLHLLDPEFAGSQKDFNDRYERIMYYVKGYKKIKDANGNLVIENGKPKVEEIDIPIKENQHLDELHERLKSIMFRVPIEDVLDIGLSEIITVELSKGQRTLYNQFRDEILVEIREKRLPLRHALTRMLRLRQAAEGIFNFDETSRESGKLEYIEQLLDEDEEERYLAWSAFKPITNILGRRPKAVVYNGDVSDNRKLLAKWSFGGCADRQELEEFNKLAKKENWELGPGEATLFASTLDIRSSLSMNLHKNCYKQILPSWHSQGTVNSQAQARLIRLNQQHNVLSMWLVGEDTIEADYLNMVLENTKNNLRVIDGVDGLSYHQIEQLLERLAA